MMETKKNLQSLKAEELKIRFVALQIRFLSDNFRHLIKNWENNSEFFFTEFENDYPFECMPEEMEQKVRQWSETSVKHLADKYGIKL